MKFGVITFPGSNCDADIIYVLEKIMGQQVVPLWHKSHDLQGVDFVVLPGGFSFGDYLRSGAIARFSPIMQEVIKFADKGGYVMGICNGFQILTEAGLLPGALLHNNNRKFICRNIYLKPQTANSLPTAQLNPEQALKIPIAHGEGNYFADADVLKAINDNDQVMFRYCDEFGNITTDANPNGSLENIAGVTNANRNVFGLMPHPERASDSLVGNQDGLAIFESVLSLVRA
ncbi:phosphoribosylformylglycinamidine synthase subunit PurQ [Mucilaginibacter myungsuensis]|uniref:Phosphoribosylformylglycinamidine synthase subunit PurQ n=1 Tax=Mucilaginibacter myungsuensis TaxID=649104 RepID=A0A929KVY1_9SPHI|nr:phosphoribosylformylglycinamidine synthase subunit PurQ [Mucilaginibacter myungsuensis]MBE9661450.1 phosphoribosylformylglycinamidine synthase subunit PurQ [Mucilaginibacter myungsuensis]MDN3597593.1 phosphoribosylformylglycinamidine synthase subunit PurQ [Mucilaginibacter myungsuensis]